MAITQKEEEGGGSVYCMPNLPNLSFIVTPNMDGGELNSVLSSKRTYLIYDYQISTVCDPEHKISCRICTCQNFVVQLHEQSN